MDGIEEISDFDCWTCNQNRLYSFLRASGIAVTIPLGLYTLNFFQKFNNEFLLRGVILHILSDSALQRIPLPEIIEEIVQREDWVVAPLEVQGKGIVLVALLGVLLLIKHFLIHIHFSSLLS